MCGIYLTNFDFPKEQVLDKIKKIKFRGPDNLGYNKIDNITLAHLRLSIIDTNIRSNQPFSFNGLHITYNGEIYNYKSIRDELEKKGYSFTTQSDTEVLLKGFDYWKNDILTKINGMFSFAIYDSNTKTIFSARDRLGVKPFYYFFNNGSFEISSQIAPLKNDNLSINEDSIVAYLRTGYIPSPLSIFKEIKKLPPGYSMTIDVTTNKIFINKYWDLKPQKIKKIKYHEAISQLEKLIEESVEIRLNSDVPFGTFLSGGIDSALVTSIASKKVKKRLKTFTIGFNEEEYDESKIAKKFSNILGTNHKEFICTQKDLIQLIPKLLEIYDEPFSDPSAIPSLLLNKKVKKDITVVLSGDGGDESFFGYNHFFIKKSVKLIFLIPFFIRRFTATMIPYRFLSKSLNKDVKTIKEIFILRSIKDYITRIFVSYPQYLNDRSKDWFNYYNKVFTLSKNIYQNIADLNIKLWLENDSNVKVDRASMAYSVEVRSPFLDYRIIEFSRTLPINYRYSRIRRKKMLRDILKKYIPEELFNLPKKGFSLPLEKWTRGQLKNEIIQTITHKNLSMISGIKDDIFMKLMDDHFNEKKDFSLSIWRMYILIKWLKKNKWKNENTISN
tara:strand:+ start:3713 stop:5554 length:1842 start_codon:yes stop_codon:yes gene_type:complete